MVDLLPPIGLFNTLPCTKLQAAINEVQQNTSAPVEMVACCALSVLSLVQQSQIDVLLPIGKMVPASCYFLVIAESGERKTTVLGKFLEPVLAFEKKMAAQNKLSKDKFKAEIKAWQRKSKEIEREFVKISHIPGAQEEYQQVLLEHEQSKPIPPRQIRLIYNDITIAALLQNLQYNIKSAGLLSSEGGDILAGKAFNDRAKINSFFSGDPVVVDRANRDSFTIDGVRLTVLIMAQPQTVSGFMEREGEDARGSGQLARFLICKPQSSLGYRQINSLTQSWVHIYAFHRRVEELLEAIARSNALNDSRRDIVKFSYAAQVRWVEIANTIEAKMRLGERYEHAKDHASKLAENVARIAALLHHFEGYNGDISIETLEAACRICEWASGCFMREFVPPPLEQTDGYVLLDWMKAKMINPGFRVVKRNHLRQFCPSQLRRENRFDRALLYLHEKGFVRIQQIGKTMYVDTRPDLPPYYGI